MEATTGIVTIHSDPFDVKMSLAKQLYDNAFENDATKFPTTERFMNELLNQPKAFWRKAVAIGFLPN